MDNGVEKCNGRPLPPPSDGFDIRCLDPSGTGVERWVYMRKPAAPKPEKSDLTLSGAIIGITKSALKQAEKELPTIWAPQVVQETAVKRMMNSWYYRFIAPLGFTISAAAIWIWQTVGEGSLFWLGQAAGQLARIWDVGRDIMYYFGGPTNPLAVLLGVLWNLGFGFVLYRTANRIYVAIRRRFVGDPPPPPPALPAPVPLLLPAPPGGGDDGGAYGLYGPGAV